MSCPPHILEPLTEILTLGLLNIRMAAAQGDTRRCHIESDHLHNLPRLIADYRQEMLKFYINVEKPIFERSNAGADLRLFEKQWAKLQA